MPVPVDSMYRRLPGVSASSTSVPVGLRPSSRRSPSLMCCRREVSGPSGTLMEKKSRPSSHDGLAMERSEEHTSELQSLMRTPYAVLCLKQQTNEQFTTE